MNAPTLSLCSVAVAGCLGAAPLYAQTPERPGEASKQSDIGVVAGLAIGAAAGGPVGAVIGAAGGALLGDHVHGQQRHAQELAADLDASRRESHALSGRVSELDGDLTRVRAQAEQLHQVVQRTDQLAMTVSFRTDEDAVADAPRAALERLGSLAAALPQSTLRVVGHADPRGSQEHNAALSLRRAQHVAEVLRAAGIAPERIIVQADGAECGAETPTVDLDAYALERRVDVQLQLPQANAVARRD